MSHAIKVKGDGRVRLDEIDAEGDSELNKEQGRARLVKLREELEELQALLYAAGGQSLLVVLQGRDTSGKDGAIRGVFSGINPQGCRVESFKVPSAEEASHDFLWRVHAKTPLKGMITIFNRSHYEDVLVVRVHNLVPEKRWKTRYDHINHFERLLIDNDTLVVKFYLHITKDEQEERLLAREQEVEKAWKLSPGDWHEREHWKAYTEAYEEALQRCSTADVPWYIVPANRKWLRDLAIAETLVATLKPHREQWLAQLEAMGKKAKDALAEMRTKTA